VTPVLAATTVGLVPWTLWLTFSLPGRRVSVHYDLAWVGFDVGLFVAFAATGWSIVRSSKWLVPLAAATGAMLLCDVWFDVVTAGPNDIGEAVAEALLAEIPLAGLCAFIVIDTERFQRATVVRYATAMRLRRWRRWPECELERDSETP